MREQVDQGIVRLNLELHEIEQILAQGMFGDPHADPDAVLTELGQIDSTLTQLEQGAALLNGYQLTFDIDPYPFAALHEVRDRFSHKRDFWTLYRDWIAKTAEWEHGPFQSVDVEMMNAGVGQFARDIHLLVKREASPLTILVRNQIDEWKAIMPILLHLGNKSLKPLHWEAMFAVIGQPYVPVDELDLQKIRAVNLLAHANLITDTVAQAVGEYSLASALANVRGLWEAVDLPVVTYRDASDVFILGDAEAVLDHLEDSQITLQTMLSSRYIASFHTDVDEWIHRLGLLGNLLEIWSGVQRAWSQLESIFGAADIGRQLPTESKRFMDVDRIWRDFMRRMHRKPSAMGVLATPGVSSILNNASKELDSLQRSLTQYLETKRSRFPRFYLLADQQLLRMIAETRQPTDIQPHLSAIFDGIRDLRFVHAGESLQVIGLTGVEGDYVVLDQSVVISGALENWLLAIEKAVKRAIQEQIRRGLEIFPKNAIGWDLGVLKQLQQVATTVERIVATFAVTNALTGGRDALDAIRSQVVTQIERYADLMRNGLRTVSQRAALAALIVANVAQRDLLNELIALSSDDSSSLWDTCVRYYWDAVEGHCNVRIDQCSFRYGYEYLGSYSALVAAPATIRCQRALAETVFCRYGGAVTSATRTGKTETVKDLAKTLGMACLVMSCDKSFDAAVFAQILSGLAQTGFWACFNNIANVAVDVISIVTQQMLTIREALIAEKTEFAFEGRTIALNPGIGIFVTLSDQDYVGIPENLKALFRPVSLEKIDMAVLLQIRLICEGFSSSEQLSPHLFALLKEFATKLPNDRSNPTEFHSIKSIPMIAGIYLRSDSASTTEEECVVRAIRKFFSGKIFGDDLTTLDSCIAIHFPSVTTSSAAIAPPISATLMNAITSEFTNQGFTASPTLLTQIMRLHESIKFNQSVILVGASGTGKSYASGVLATALISYIQQDPKENIWRSLIRNYINPVALTFDQIYGRFDGKSRQWIDGVCSRLFRENSSSTSQIWITFDGPINATWTEPLGNVLDENQQLCLLTGERLRIPSCVKLLFETDDLKEAPPSFLSRCTLVYFNDQFMNTGLIIDKWCADFQLRFSSRSSKLISLIRDHIPSILEYSRSSCTEGVRSSSINLITSFFTLLDIVLVPERGADPSLHSEGVNRVTAMYFLFAVVWSIGANLDERSQSAFSTFIRGKFAKGRSSGVPLPPEQGSVYDYFVSSERAAYLPWSQKIESSDFDPTHSMDNVIVPTTDTVRYRFMLEAFTSAGAHSLIASKSGVGKSSLIQSFLKHADQRLFTVPLLLSSLSTVENIHEQIERRLDMKRRAILSPPAGKKLAVYIDDLNLPLLSSDSAGEATVEFIRQCIDYDGFYDPSKLVFKRLVDQVFICAMSPSVPGVCQRPALSPRLLRHFQLIWWAEPNDACTRAVFGSILSAFVRVANPELDECAKALITVQLSIAQRLQRRLRKSTEFYSEYLFSFHDFSNICRGMLLTESSHKFADKASFVNLWAHEFTRVVRDRFASPSDASAIDAVIIDVLKTAMPTITPSLSQMYWVTVSDDGSPAYNMAPEKTKMLELYTSHLDKFNQSNVDPINLVLFEDAVPHICRLSRILAIPGGHAALIGHEATDRQSITRLSAHISNMTCIMTSRSSLSPKNWRSDLQKLITMAGVEDQRVVCCISDSDISEDAVLGDVGCLVSTGDMNYIFGKEELEQILNRVRTNAESIEIELGNRDEVMTYFHHCIRKNTHIVLTLSPDSPDFPRYGRCFPFLGQFTVDTYQPWTDQQRQIVAQKFVCSKIAL